MSETEILIIGAGLCGLTAARELRRRGREVIVIEKGPRVQGRLAGLEFDGARFDMGAQFFTARSPEFRAVVGEWMAAGIVSEWFTGMPTWPGGIKEDGYPRYRAMPSMAALAEVLARGTEVRTSAEISRIELDEKWTATTRDGEQFTAEWLISTPPMAEAYGTFLPSEVAIYLSETLTLSTLRYEPCLALAVVLDRPSSVPVPGALQMDHEVFSWIADNFQKGISRRPGAVTLHANGAWSAGHLQDSEEDIVSAMLEAARPWLGAEVVSCRLWRWGCAKAVNPLSMGAMEIPGRKLVFAGDSFAGSKVEGAVVSGVRAAGMVG